MTRRASGRLLFGLAAALLFAPGTAFGLGMVRMSPNLGQFICKTTDPLRVAFDRTVDPASLSEDSFFVTLKGRDDPLSGTLALETTEIPGDTVVFTPEPQFRFGEHYIVHITEDLAGADQSPFDGGFPQGDEFVPNIPTDFEIPTWNPDDVTQIFIESNMLVGFDPLDPEGTDPAEYTTYPGCSATEAWKITTGNPAVLIGVIDNGMGSMNDPELRDRYFLNRGELPLPNVAGVLCADYDCNGDGAFNWRDYEDDDRLAGYENRFPGTLIAHFKDGVDDDGNGLVDDISGYDFFRGVPEAEGVDEFPEGTHGGGRADDAAATADNGVGNRPGVCPNCSILPLRVGPAILGDYNAMARAALYANEMGAQLIVLANGTFNYSEYADEAFLEAYRNGTLTIAASGDENGFHHVYPAHGEMVMSIKAVLPIPNIVLEDYELIPGLEIDLDAGEVLVFLESYCTNFGVHTSVTAPTGACSSHATSITGGVAGLVVSRAVDLGIELSPNEVLQILQMTADDIKEKCLTITPGNCKPGWDEHWGYGRVNALTAVRALGDPERGLPARIPPEVEILEPRWFDNFDPDQTPSVDIEGRVYARGDAYTYEVAWAVGPEPDDEVFTIIQTGAGTEPTEGKLATLDLAGIFPREHFEAPPQDPDDFTVTIRVRARKLVDGEPVYGEYRKAFAVHRDRDERTGLLPGFPISLEASAESPVALWDLSGRGEGKLDIIFGGGDGLVRVYRYSESSGTWEMAPGFPVDTTPPDADWPIAIVGGPAVGKLLGDDRSYIVVTTYGGQIYAIQPEGNEHPDGPFLPGFPFTAEKNPPYPNIGYGHGNAFISTPALGDLDKDGMLEIVATNYNMKVYALRPVDDDGDGVVDHLPGWPVLAQSLPGLVPPEKECGRYGIPSPILVSPSVAILDPVDPDPDISEYPAVIVGTAEVCERRPNDFPDVDVDLDTGRVYAIYHDGNDNPDGPFLPGWPALLIAPFGGAIPIPPLTIGVTSSPAVAHDSGRTYIGTGTFFFPPQILSWEAGEMQYLLGVNILSIGASANGTFAHLLDNGRLQYIVPTVGVNLENLLGHGTTMNFQMSVYDVRSPLGNAAAGMLDDADFFVNPVVADIDGDGPKEMIAGSGGYLLRAWDGEERQPEGWPKFTQHFITTTPQVGDLDGDGLFEVVLADHEGSLWAWNTTGPACDPWGIASEWYRFRHDEHNSGWMNHDVLPPQRVWDLAAYRLDRDEDRVTLTFTAPGDDWGCGFVKSLDIRYTEDPDADLSDPAVFAAAPRIPASAIGQVPAGGERMRVTIDLPAAVRFALRAEDADGNTSTISNVADVGLTAGRTLPAESDAADLGGDADDDGCCGG